VTVPDTWQELSRDSLLASSVVIRRRARLSGWAKDPAKLTYSANSHALHKGPGLGLGPAPVWQQECRAGCLLLNLTLTGNDVSCTFRKDVWLGVTLLNLACSTSGPPGWTVVRPHVCCGWIRVFVVENVSGWWRWGGDQHDWYYSAFHLVAAPYE